MLYSWSFSSKYFPNFHVISSLNHRLLVVCCLVFKLEETCSSYLSIINNISSSSPRWSENILWMFPFLKFVATCFLASLRCTWNPIQSPMLRHLTSFLKIMLPWVALCMRILGLLRTNLQYQFLEVALLGPGQMHMYFISLCQIALWGVCIPPSLHASQPAAPKRAAFHSPRDEVHCQAFGFLPIWWGSYRISVSLNLDLS